MPDPSGPADRTPAQREADHAGLARLSETLVPALVAKLNASGLGELEVHEGGWRIRLRRSAVPGAPGGGGRRSERPRLAGHAPEREARAPRDAARDAAREVRADTVQPRRALASSPTVGIFSPTATVGAHLEAGDRIGTVDLLGIPQDIAAPVDGTLVEMLATAGDAVEYGEAVAAIEVDPAETPAGDADREG